MEEFRRYRTISDVARTVAERFKLEPTKTLALIDGFVNKLVDEGFLHRRAYREREREAFPKLKFAGTLYLHMTNKCNLKCPYCYNKTDRETKIKLERLGMVDPILSTQEYKDLIGRAIECGAHHLIFTGGEALMRPDAMDLIKFARQKSSTIKLEMLTNATKIDDRIAEQMCASLDIVTISLDGHEKHMHELYRGKHTFEPTIRGIKCLIKKRLELRRQKPFVCLVPVLTEKNVINLKEIYQFSLEELGADNLAPVLFQAGDHQQVSVDQIPKMEIFQQEATRLSNYLQQMTIIRPEAQDDSLLARNHCGAGGGEISVDPSGFVYPCQSLHFPEFVAGNVRETDIQEIFDDSPVLNRQRGTTVETLAVCSHCDVRFLCNGGCRATAYNVYGQMDAHNELYCNYLETMAVGKLWGKTQVSSSPN
ncbi:MAG TPA: radical SAM protein [Candidatus Angelobacter sp.]|nr:radical SAM protein [Candidatus Angelobacter sp.]